MVLQAIPRKLWLDKSGKQLVQWPVVEIEKLRGKKVELSNKLLKGGSVVEVSGITAVQVSSNDYARGFLQDNKIKVNNIWMDISIYRAKKSKRGMICFLEFKFGLLLF